MELKLLVCPVCGSNEIKEENGMFVCCSCKNKFYKKAAEEEAIFLEKLQQKFDEQELKHYSNAKFNLWQETHKEYLSNSEIKTWCNKVKEYSPNDFFANFYYIATFSEVDSVCEYLVEFIKGKDYKFADEVLRYLIKTADSERLIQPLIAILDVAEIESGEKDKLQNEINELAEKLDNGVFVTNIPRDVFVCYSSKDIGIVTELIDYIELNGFSCFCAQRNLRHGKGAKENYAEELKTAMKNCKCVVFVSSENSRRLDCDAVKIEIPFLKEYLPETGRIEYVIDKDKYSKTVPVVKRALTDYFKNLEFCTDKDDLVDRIFDNVSGFGKEKEDEKTKALEEQLKAQAELLKQLAEKQETAATTSASKEDEKTRALEEQLKAQAELLKKLTEEKKETTTASPAKEDERSKKLEEQLKALTEQMSKMQTSANTVNLKHDSNLDLMEAEKKQRAEEERNIKGYSVKIGEYDTSKKISVIKLVMEVAGKGLIDAKQIVDDNKLFYVAESREKLDELTARFKEVGAELEVEKLSAEEVEKTGKYLEEVQKIRDILREKKEEEKKKAEEEINRKEEEEKKAEEERKRKEELRKAEEERKHKEEERKRREEEERKRKEEELRKIEEEKKKKAEEERKKLETEQLASAKVGDEIIFGTYPQGENGEVEPIEWQVLDITDNKAFLISKRILDSKCIGFVRTEWETCDLNEWLINEFYFTAFDSDEQERTEGSVSLLWPFDYEKYKNKIKTNKNTITPYARQKGLTDPFWWIITPGYEDRHICVTPDGIKNYKVTMENGVRPVIKVDKYSAEERRAEEERKRKEEEERKRREKERKEEEKKREEEELKKNRYCVVKDGVVKGYKGKDTKVVIPDGVTSIGENAFKECNSLISIVIPDSVTSIGTNAFEGCKSLKNIKIPNGVTSIGNYAFCGCHSLAEIVIPNGVTSIGNSVFGGCNSFTSIVIPDGVTSIGEWAFSGCNSLTKIVIPDSVKSIDHCAFFQCKSLTDIVIPDGVKKIGAHAFEDCKSLTDIVIPDGVPEIMEKAFYRCYSLKKVTIGKGVKSIGNHAFFGCKSLTSIVIPDYVTSIGESAFEDCESLKEVTMGKGVKKIEAWAFGGCHSLAEIVIPDGVTKIEEGAFCECKSFTSIVIPDGVTSIGEKAFYYCVSLSSIVIPDSVSSISDYAFAECDSLESVTIGKGANNISSVAFEYCYALNEVTIRGDYGFDKFTWTVMERVTILSLSVKDDKIFGERTPEGLRVKCHKEVAKQIKKNYGGLFCKIKFEII